MIFYRCCRCAFVSPNARLFTKYAEHIRVCRASKACKSRRDEETFDVVSAYPEKRVSRKVAVARMGELGHDRIGISEFLKEHP